ncbi:MAG: glutamate racemase [Anaerolineales bacterium]|nr:glutamate racemase [Anaerolineales bacterium]
MAQGSIGIFDSGVGGLSILAQIRRRLPEENILYFADQAHVPYGPRDMQEVREFSETITQYLIDGGAKIIVVACNTASAAALHYLRRKFPDTPFVGMEPAVRPAARTSKSLKVGVLATPATFQGALFESVVERFAHGVDVIEQTLPGLVERIEENDLNGPQTRAILKDKIVPLIDAGVDTLVLACTHYPFVIPTIEDLFGSSLVVIDPSPAIARQTERLLDENELRRDASAPGDVTYISTDDAYALVTMAVHLINTDGTSVLVNWDGRSLRQKKQN